MFDIAYVAFKALFLWFMVVTVIIGLMTSSPTASQFFLDVMSCSNGGQ